jgi:hypothetical protein
MRGVFGWFRTTVKVACFGETHLDTIATSGAVGARPDIPGAIVHRGTIVHAVGGNAFNVAANLAREDKDRKLVVRLVTVLPKYSVMTDLFRRRMYEIGIGTEYVHSLTTLNGRVVHGGGYVAWIDADKRHTRLAISEPALHEVDIFAASECRKAANAALRWADTIVAATSLSASSLGHLLNGARKRGSHLFVVIGSTQEGREHFLPALKKSAGASTAISARYQVLRNLLEGRLPDEHLAAIDAAIRQSDSGALSLHAKNVCESLKTQHALVTYTEQMNLDFALMSANGDAIIFRAPDDVNIRLQDGNTAGLNDAAMTGLIRALHTQRALRRQSKGLSRLSRLDVLGASGQSNVANDVLQLSDQDTRKLITHHIELVSRNVSESRGPTPGSVVNLEEEESLQSRTAQTLRYLKMAVDATGLRALFGALSGAAIKFIAAIFVAFVAVEYFQICQSSWKAFAPVCRLLGAGV